MQIFGILGRASFESLSANPAAGTLGRFWWNSTDGRPYFDTGTLDRAFLLNDQKHILGNSGTAAENIRLHRGAAGVLQFLSGADTTAEGSLSAALNQLSSRLENYTNAGKPAFGNAGRLIYVTDLSAVLFDTGLAWVNVGSSSIFGDYSATSASLAYDNTTKKYTFLQGTPNTTFKAGVVTGTIAIHEQVSGGNAVSLSAPAGLAASYGLTLPAALPTTNKQIATFTSAGVASFEHRSIGTLTSKAFADSPYTALNTDETILVTTAGGAVTINLPAAASNTGKKLFIKKTSADFTVVTIDGNAAETIDGALTTTLNTQNEALLLQSDGSNWVILHRRIPSIAANYTPSAFTGFGTVGSVDIWMARFGSQLRIYGRFTAGTVTGSTGGVAIPTGLVTEAISFNTIIGSAAATTILVGLHVLAIPSSGSVSFVRSTASANNTAEAGSVVSATGSNFSFSCMVPIAGWSS